MLQVHHLQFDANSRPTVRGADPGSAMVVPARGRELGGRPARRGRARPPSAARIRSAPTVASRSWRPLPKRRATAGVRANSRGFRRKYGGPSSALGRPDAAREVFASGQWGQRAAHGQRAAGAGHTGGPWRSGSARPATTTPSGRALLSAGSAGGEDAALLRQPVPHGRDQLHVLPHAHGQASPAGWRATPATFRFTLKAPRRITHDKRLKDVGDSCGFCDLAGDLGPQLGALLFQMPPNLKCNLDVFDAFLDTLPRRSRRRSSSGTTRGSTTRSTSACGRATSRCASPTPATSRADRRDRRLRLLPPARRGLPAADIGAGPRGPRRSGALARRVRLLQARRRRQGPGVRPALA